MEKTVKKLIKTGYGLGLLSLSQAKKVTTKMKKELNLSEKESLKLARELVANSEKLSKEVLKVAKRHFEGALRKSGVSKSQLRVAKKVVKKKLKSVKSKVKTKVKKRLKK